MNRSRAAARRRSAAGRLVLGWVAGLAPAALAPAQEVAAPPSAEAPAAVPLPLEVAPEAPGAAVVGIPATDRIEPALPAPELAPEVQVVRFQTPAGVTLETLGPAPVPVAVADPSGLAPLGLRVGTGYRFRLAGLPNRPGEALYPVVQMVGHLHRPPGIDPGRYPVRIPIRDEDIDDALLGRLVTLVVYLEDPEQALPISLPKDEVPVVTLSAAEDPMRVARALGRPVAIVQLGTREPQPSDLDGAAIEPVAAVACPWVGPSGDPCGVACGPLPDCVELPLSRPTLPPDEFLCDGGDQPNPSERGGAGESGSLQPRDALIRFQADGKPRVLPTNVVCLYAPRFAVVRRGVGASEHVKVENLAGRIEWQHAQHQDTEQGPRRLDRNEAPGLFRHRGRPSEAADSVGIARFLELRVLDGLDMVQNVDGHVTEEGSREFDGRVKPITGVTPVRLQGQKTAEAAVVTGIVTGANEQKMTWPPQEVAGVELPPNRPGVAVIKQVDATEAQPGDVVTYTIRYRNMGNVPIRAVSASDSLLPRLEYVKGSARGPKGAVFSASPNAAGSVELRWDLPGELKPGAEGSVSFQAKVR